MHRFLLYNDEIRDTTDSMLRPGQVGLLNGWGVFSTLRVKDGVLFAWERHWARMGKDAALMHVPMPATSDALLRPLLALIDANHAFDATLRVAVIRNRGGIFDAPNLDREFDVIAFTKDLAAWKDGVRLGVKPNARHAGHEFSGTKVLSWSMNLTWLEEAQRAGFDEVVLLDDQGRVSECTSANLFVVKGSDVLTPPLTNGCLPGVTRALLLEDIRVPGISVREHELTLQDLAASDDVFITSSTRDLLGVSEVGGVPIPMDGRVRHRLHQAFQDYLHGYVSRVKAPVMESLP